MARLRPSHRRDLTRFWPRLRIFEGNPLLHRLLTAGLRLFGLFQRGRRNALEVSVVHYDLPVVDLPEEWVGKKVLLLSDLHIDGFPELQKVLLERLASLEVDICVFTGDYRFRRYGNAQPTIQLMKPVVQAVRSHHGVFAVLGNHDNEAIADGLTEMGVEVLRNRSKRLLIYDAALWLVGIDDPHFFRQDNIIQAFEQVPKGDSSLFLGHSAERYQQAAAAGADVYLCGHTHGGQICLPGGWPPFTHLKLPRRFAKGFWQHQNMVGYTTSGVGVSGTVVRFFCPPEMVLFRLVRAQG